MLFKIFWFFRGLLYKLFLGRYKLPSYIGKPMFISNFKRIFIGKKVRIFPNCRMEVLDKNSSLILNDDISIGQNFHIISGGEQDLIIGKGCTISANVFITNIAHEYIFVGEHILSQPIIANKTKIGNNCFIGYGAVIQDGTILGDHCIVGANAVVKGIFPDYCVIVGIPARIIKRYDFDLKEWRKTNKNGEFI